MTHWTEGFAIIGTRRQRNILCAEPKEIALRCAELETDFVRSDSLRGYQRGLD